jgi:hypothetical protein
MTMAGKTASENSEAQPPVPRDDARKSRRAAAWSHALARMAEASQEPEAGKG